jgi:hypothetical protein
VQAKFIKDVLAHFLKNLTEPEIFQMSNSMIENISPKQKGSTPLSKTSTPKPENLSLSKAKPVV